MKKFYLETFGCQMNVHDSEKVVGTLESRGYEQVETPEAADLVLYNTCSIRDKAEQKVFHRLDQFKRTGKDKLFGVLGCVAQQEGEKIFDKAPHVSMVVGSASYSKLPELLVQLEAGGRRVTGLSLDTDETFETPLTRRDNPHRAYITIIEGCDKSCSYCVVPFTRGPERSRTSESVMEESHSLAAAGYSEIQLLGQNVNSYRDPSSAGWDFARLLEAVGHVPGVRRVRFTTSHPRDFVKEIIDAIDRTPTLCNMVHLPVQSGSTKVLAAMDRQYTRDEYMRRIEWMKNAERDIAISTDVIVGFPGETEEDFEDTLAVVAEASYDSAYTFIFSPRPGTRAAELHDDFIAPEVIAARFDRLKAVVDRASLARHQGRVGRTEEVLVEGVSRRDEAMLTGRTRQGKLVHFAPTAPGMRGTPTAGALARVTITAGHPHHLSGRLVEVTARPRHRVRIPVASG